ncbi:LOW QUALITY PROTEIN: hypothetical protein HID58_079429 [Brassica napus]|uniref:Uncharacterized protein n=1 Tax=Brassica napus TaxID=3708 RepID=A0ABQ7Y206_BRANA|nr:LOW QUALITY PROTEIN: hypothetical protein HID58_079429 [Brassica napus]
MSWSTMIQGLQLFVSVLLMFRPVNFTRTYLGYVWSLRSLLLPELVPRLLESGASCSTSTTKYGGVKKIESVMVSELNAYALNASSSVTYCNGGNNHPSGDATRGAICVSASAQMKLTETNIAIGSGEVPVKPQRLY